VLALEGVFVSDFANLAGRTGVVTGGSTGIGRATALEMAAAGADVLVHYARNRNAAEETCQAIEALGRRTWLMQADFHEPAACEQFVQDSWATLGAIDIWVHNAGVDLLTGPAAELSFAAKLDELLLVDVRATMLITKAVGEQMRQAGRGNIITIGWDQADRGMEGNSGELFAAAKNSVMGFTRSLAVSLAPQVRVNCIAPGWIRTAWGDTASEVWQQRVLRETPLLRWGLPADIAKLARFLVSDDASFITGQVINANGGAVR
jgi:3-oxoacyl-[acyl-carrier protein] reductase